MAFSASVRPEVISFTLSVNDRLQKKWMKFKDNSYVLRRQSDCCNSNKLMGCQAKKKVACVYINIKCRLHATKMVWLKLFAKFSDIVWTLDKNIHLRNIIAFISGLR